jgi:signal transduction histidine kinase
LHDGRVQNLTAVSLDLSTAAAKLTRGNASERECDDVARIVSSASNQARSAIRELRSLIIEIAPPDLDSGGLHDAVDRLLATARDTGLRTQLSIENIIDLPADSAALVYRVAQESLRNVLKHAHASSVIVRIAKQDGEVTLTVEDDGSGFTRDTLAQRRHEGHLGLALLEDRVREQGGTLTVRSAPGAGTSVQLRVADA